MSAGQRYEGFVPGLHVVEGYGKGGFMFAGMSHRGSILALPSGIRAWAPVAPEDIDEATLAALFAEPPGAVELLLVGTGARLTPTPKSVRDALKRTGIRLELMATGAATATYNLLLEEKRRVGAALIAVP